MFKDEIKKIVLPQIEIPKLKGHTKIELTDVHTGKKEVIEHDNTFQSAVVAAYMRSMGALNNNPYNNSTWRGIDMLRNFVGGIFCFESTIASGAKYMPAGNRMIANGAYGISNSTTPVELGSYNSIESVLDNDSATFVYDWNTAQGNGEISCICLTSETGGLIGYGNPSGGKYANPIALDRNQSSNDLGNFILGDNMGFTFSVDNTAKTLTVTKKRLAISKATVFDNKNIETITLNYTTALDYAGNFLFRHLKNEKIAIIPWSNINNNSTRNFLIYDYSNDTLEERKIINTTGKYLLVTLYWPYEEGTNFGIIDDHAFIFDLPNSSSGSSTTLFKFNTISGTLEETITASEARYFDDYWTSETMGKLTTDLYAYGGVNHGMVIYDKINNTTHPANGVYAVNKGSVSPPYNFWNYDDKNDVIVTDGGTAGESITHLRCIKNPLFLATINNLDSPVLKTASKTMKITYTLTEAS